MVYELWVQKLETNEFRLVALLESGTHFCEWVFTEVLPTVDYAYYLKPRA